MDGVSREQFLSRWRLEGEEEEREQEGNTLLNNSTLNRSLIYHLTEPVQYENQIINLPVSLICSRTVLAEIFSENVWHNYLTEKERTELMKYLPPQYTDIDQLWNNLLDPTNKYSFVQPLKKLIRDLKAGYLHPKVIQYKKEYNEQRLITAKSNLISHEMIVLQNIIQFKDRMGVPTETYDIQSIFSPPAIDLQKELNKLTASKQKLNEVASNHRRHREKRHRSHRNIITYLTLVDSDLHNTESEGSATDPDSDIGDSGEDEDYEELTRKAKRHKQYKMQKKEKKLLLQ